MDDGLTCEYLLILAISFPQRLPAALGDSPGVGISLFIVSRKIRLVCKFRGLRRGVV
jgi:hypothetical protein